MAGCWGYIEAWREMMEQVSEVLFAPHTTLSLYLVQGVTDNFTDLVVSIGSGGTIAGLAVGNYLTGSKIK